MKTIILFTAMIPFFSLSLSGCKSDKPKKLIERINETENPGDNGSEPGDNGSENNSIRFEALFLPWNLNITATYQEESQTANFSVKTAEPFYDYNTNSRGPLGMYLSNLANSLYPDDPQNIADLEFIIVPGDCQEPQENRGLYHGYGIHSQNETEKLRFNLFDNESINPSTIIRESTITGNFAHSQFSDSAFDESFYSSKRFAMYYFSSLDFPYTVYYCQNSTRDANSNSKIDLKSPWSLNFFYNENKLMISTMISENNQLVTNTTREDNSFSHQPISPNLYFRNRGINALTILPGDCAENPTFDETKDLHLDISSGIVGDHNIFIPASYAPTNQISIYFLKGDPNEQTVYQCINTEITTGSTEILPLIENISFEPWKIDIQTEYSPNGNEPVMVTNTLDFRVVGENMKPALDFLDRDQNDLSIFIHNRPCSAELTYIGELASADEKDHIWYYDWDILKNNFDYKIDFNRPNKIFYWPDPNTIPGVQQSEELNSESGISSVHIQQSRMQIPGNQYAVYTTDANFAYAEPYMKIYSCKNSTAISNEGSEVTKLKTSIIPWNIKVSAHIQNDDGHVTTRVKVVSQLIDATDGSNFHAYWADRQTSQIVVKEGSCSNQTPISQLENSPFKLAIQEFQFVHGSTTSVQSIRANANPFEDIVDNTIGIYFIGDTGDFKCIEAPL